MRSDGKGSELSELIGIEEASEILRVSTRTVQNMMKKGLLTALYEKSQDTGRLQTRFRRTEVCAAAEAALENTDTPKAANMAARALALSQHNDRRIQSVLELLGLKGDSIPFDEEGVVALYADAQEKLHSAFSLTENDAIHWSRVLMQISEEYLDLLKTFTGSPEPWRVFMLLGERLSEDLRENVSSTSNTTQMFLSGARRHFRNTSFFFVKNRDNRSAAAEVKGDEIDESIINLLFLH